MGVSKSATLPEIKKAYFTLAKKYHPDLNKAPDAKERFTEISEAYDTLSDENKRRQYDLGGQSYNQPFNNYNFYYSNFNDINSNFFKDFLNLFTERENDFENKDIFLAINLSFRDSIMGGNKKIKYKKIDKCQECKGFKCKGNERPKQCFFCEGYGKIKIRRMWFLLEQNCDYCQGKGYIIKNKCNKCNGNGYEYKTVTEDINIPKGIENGENIKIRNLGNFSVNDFSFGDLYLRVNVEEDPVFRRNKSDIFSDKEIEIPTAVLGGTVPVETIYGFVNMKVKPGTKHGNYINIGKYGIEKNNGINYGIPYKMKGNHYVRIQIKIPSKGELNKEELKCFEKLKFINDNKYKY